LPKNIIPNVYEFENFYNEKDLEIILSKFKENKKWDQIVQDRPGHYSHVFQNDALSMPDEGESYSASFSKNLELVDDAFIRDKTKEAIRKNLADHFNVDDFSIDLRCHKFEKNDYFRIHTDSYLASYALTISLNKNWKWDWGRILSIAYGEKFSKLISLLPKWNSANLLSNDIEASPHFVTSIREFALEARYNITCFIKSKKIEIISL